MKKIDITPEEAELMNYNDIAHLILTECGKKMKITDLFDEVGKVLELDVEEYKPYIGDFFELLSTDKRFIMLDDGFWDLKIKHNKGMETFEDEDDDDELIVEEDDLEMGEEEYDESRKTADDDVDDDDLSDLVIVDDLDEEANL